jgi:hypothetical protein
MVITVVAMLTAIAGGSWTAAMAASSPRTAAGRAKVTTSDLSVVVGPFVAKGGYMTEIEAVDCNTTRGGVVVTYERGNAHVALVHTYEGADSSCTVAKNLETATLKVKWGTVLNLNLKLAGTAKLKHAAVQGCTGSRFEYRGVGATGTTILAIHAADFGRLVRAKPTVQLSAVVGSGCTSSSGTGGLPVSGGTSGRFSIAHGHSALARAWSVGQARAVREGALSIARPATQRPAFTTTTPMATTTTTVTTPSPTTTTVTGPATTVTTPAAVPQVTPDGTGTVFEGIFNRTLVIQSQTLARYTPLTIIYDYATDDPAPEVQGEMDAVIETPSAFTAVAGDGSAHLDSYGSFITGQLGFTATRACHGAADVLDGTLTGRFSVKDPVFGTLTFNGPTALGAALGNGDANFDNC